MKVKNGITVEALYQMIFNSLNQYEEVKEKYE